MKESKEQAPQLGETDLMYATHGNAVDFLTAFGAMRRSKQWRKIGFDHEALDWIARVWGEAAIACAGNTGMRDACLAEQARYEYLSQDLKNGMMYRRDVGVVFLDDSRDWPRQEVIEGAIKALAHAQIGRLQ